MTERVLVWNGRIARPASATKRAKDGVLLGAGSPLRRRARPGGWLRLDLLAAHSSLTLHEVIRLKLVHARWLDRRGGPAARVSASSSSRTDGRP